MPQAANTPAATTDDGYKFPDGDNPMADRQIRRAVALENQRGVLLKQINANRELLRLMDESDELSNDQADWLDVFYPLKEGGVQRSQDEVEATRKAREAARAAKL